MADYFRLGRRATVPEAKLKDYLLSTSHPEGKSKAKFFLRHGYAPNTLKRDLIAIAQAGAVVKEEATPYGTKFAIAGSVEAPSGTNVSILTVWIVEPGEEAPRLVTARPS